MRIRTLVPALACLIAAPFAAAEDSAPAIKIDGFVDSILAGTSTIDSSGLDGTTDNDSNSGFSYAAKLGFAATIAEKVSAQVDIVVGDESAAYVRQAYGVWKITPDVELKSGKFINNFGWIAAYSPGLYRVNGGPITGFYGVDQIGADLKYTKGQITAALTVANGFFDEGGDQFQSDVGQTDQAYAYALDVVFKANDQLSVNVEAAYDMDANPSGGDGMHLALNATFTPSEPLLAGVEVIYQSISEAEGQTEAQDHLGVMAMVNYKLGTALPVPASVTAMVQYVDVSAQDHVTDADTTEMELSLALLTNPAGTDKLGANFEVFYKTNEATKEVFVTAEDLEKTELGVAAELLFVF